MALVIEFSPEAEAQIRMKATVRGQDVTEYLLTLTENDQAIDLTEFEDQADFDASVEGIREGLADLEAGRTYSLEEMSALLEEDKAAWRREQAEKHLRSQTAPDTQ
ncbi:MAG: hypothetical protein ACRYFS_12640 [Janthinobacterium lividum]